MTEEPELYVQVAEALGWTDVQPCGNIMLPDSSFYDGRPPGAAVIIGSPQEGRCIVPRYDIDWSATGPILERLRLGLIPLIAPHVGFTASCHTEDDLLFEYGATPLIAACNLLLELKKDEKL
jgi:hypothetical protein